MYYGRVFPCFLMVEQNLVNMVCKQWVKYINTILTTIKKSNNYALKHKKSKWRKQFKRKICSFSDQNHYICDQEIRVPTVFPGI